MKLSLALANLSLFFIAACCSAPAPAAPPEPPTEPPATTEPTPPVVTPPVETPAMCGGIAAIKCPAGSFCDVAGHCGAGDQSGVCAELPTVCTRDLRPVCGCDGKTYGNACTAHASGVSVASDGECQHP